MLDWTIGGAGLERRAPFTFKNTPSDAKHMPVDEAACAGIGDLLEGLSRMGLISPGERPHLTSLTGGVSSDIVRVDLVRGPVCVKRALAKLKVHAEWRAPIERSRWEAEWLKIAGAIVPGGVPRVLAEDTGSGMFAMEYLDPTRYPVWKQRLRDGIADPAFAAEVGRRIALIHARTAALDEVAVRFATDHIFLPIRLEPYLSATARVHTDCARQLEALVQVTRTTKLALVHGDVSPKNILCAASGPVFLDAECAWFGDPAFDLAFCLNHMLLKCLWRPRWTEAYLACYEALTRAYLQTVTWEPAVRVESRAAHLLPGLFLARVDGKSPVEYVTMDWQREAVRSVARRYLFAPVEHLREIRDSWRDEIGRHPSAETSGNA
jgi:tRNA A-37 threonylcarbamoyl transferase component Bud32